MYNQKLKAAIVSAIKKGKFKNQLAIANVIGIADTTLSSIITGFINPSQKLKNRIAIALKVSQKSIF